MRGQIDRSAPGLVRVNKKPSVDLMADYVGPAETVNVALTAEELAILRLAMHNQVAISRSVSSRLRRKDGPEEKDAADAAYEATVALRNRLEEVTI